MRVACPICGKVVDRKGAMDHVERKHPGHPISIGDSKSKKAREIQFAIDEILKTPPHGEFKP